MDREVPYERVRAPMLVDLTPEEKWQAAYLQYRGKVRTFARNSYRQIPGHTVEDLEQEILMVLWKCTTNYDPNRGASFNTLFQGSAKNRIISLIRHHSTKGRTGVTISLAEEAVSRAVDEFLASDSAEDRALRIMEVQEIVAEHGMKVLDGKRGRRRAS